MQQPSLRKTRAAVGQTIEAINQHSEAINRIGAAHNALAAKVKDQGEALDSLIDRGFFGRLKWLVVGR